jgi:hypothetical protein
MPVTPQLDIKAIVEDWIYSQLAADSDTGSLVGHNTVQPSQFNIYPDELPDGYTYPAITYSDVSGGLEEAIANGNIISHATGLYQVVAHGRQDQIVDLRTLAARIRAVLHEDDEVAVTGGTILGSSMDRALSWTDPPDSAGVVYLARGGQFYIMAQLTEDE